jgi:hypothetical protein
MNLTRMNTNKQKYNGKSRVLRSVGQKCPKPCFVSP